MLAFLIVLSTFDAFAIGLEQADVRSNLGEPLRLVVPVRLGANESLNSNCVQTLNRGRADDVPTIVNARVAIDRTGGSSVLVITTRESIYEPAVRVVVQAGCSDAVTREYVFLLDPAVSPQLARTGAAQPDTAGARSTNATSANDRPETPSAASRATADGSATSAPKVQQRKPRQAAVQAPKASASASAPAAIGSPAVVPARPTAPAVKGGDRVRLAEAPPPTQGSKRDDGVEAERAKEAANKAIIDAQNAREVELNKQLASLGAQIEQLKKQIADESVRSAVVETRSVPLWWMFLLAGLALIALLIAVGIYARYRRMVASGRRSPWWQETRLRADQGYAASVRGSEASGAAVGVTRAGSGVTSTRPRRIRPDDDEGEFGVHHPTEPARDYGASDERSAVAHRQDTRIEVEELGHSQAMHVFNPRQTVPAAAQRDDTTSTVLLTSLHTPTDAPLSHIDFDLDSPMQTVPPPLRSEARTSVSAPHVPSLQQTSPNSILRSASPSLPGWLETQGAGMSWGDAKQAQVYLREVAEAVEQADAYAAAGQLETAASLLRRLINEREAGPPAPWLLLMQLYRRSERKDAYDGIGAQFSARFGRNPPPWTATPVTQNEPGLDADPELLQAIWAKWGSPDSMALISQILYDTKTDDGRFFNLALQRDVLNFVKICPLES